MRECAGGPCLPSLQVSRFTGLERVARARSPFAPCAVAGGAQQLGYRRQELSTADGKRDVIGPI